MTNSQTSGSEPAGTSEAFFRLHPKLQRWIYDEGWTSLHDAQERAIAPILDGGTDVIISAATAAGKTEAAFLPICTVLTAERDAAAGVAPANPWEGHNPWEEPAPEKSTGIEVLYLSPLKALINDQYDRLEQICDYSGIPVHRWHGDVLSSAKKKALSSPSGVLLITPESLEALFVNRGTRVPSLFRGLHYVVVDEMHSFLSNPRGAQLQSLLGRVELAIRRRPPRIGLSATLGDMSAAAAFLRASNPDDVLIISSSSDGQGLRLRVRGYLAGPPPVPEIVDHLSKTLRGTDNLVFANARQAVEMYADALARRCAEDRVPNEFWPHHGSLAADLRQDLEAHLKDRTRPVTAVCTSTLEMGIDIGSVTSIAQIGPPPSVASLRQRLGRSGRRSEPAVLRVYVTEAEVDARSSPVDELRCSLVHTVAMIRLLLAQWIEPPDDPGLNLSTLVQQVLSAIAQCGGASAADLYGALCGPGPFGQVDRAMFAHLLRAMAAADLIMQASDGLLLHGSVGERMVNHYSFYAAFHTPEEWRLVASGRTLGTLPIAQPLFEGGLLIFAGRRWKITGIDADARVVELVHASGGVPPRFGGSGALVGDHVRAEMAAVYQNTDVPEWLDRSAASLLKEGRAAWRRFGLDAGVLVRCGKGTNIFPWLGDRALITAALALASEGLEASLEGPSLAVTGASPEDLAVAARAPAKCPPPDPVSMAHGLQNTGIDKWDWVLDADLSAEAAAARLLDVPGAWRILNAMAADE